jgi:hypothetical protein
MTIRSRLDVLEHKHPQTAKTDSLFPESLWFVTMESA